LLQFTCQPSRLFLQTILSQKENVSAGLQTLQLPVSGLANGSYLVNITDAAGNRIGVKRFSIAH
jgi:hypothetical protein